ncbi:hypothetical protein [Streptomyces sp. NPDC057686]|uniref:hypothetical protein n=1 Tax=Streptomyces sp. NPDC057686 TaxID=3346212 RepID=UPI00368C62B6
MPPGPATRSPDPPTEGAPARADPVAAPDPVARIRRSARRRRRRHGRDPGGRRTGAAAPLHEAAALGLLGRGTEFPAAGAPPADEPAGAFRAACRRGQLPTAPYLLSHRVDGDRLGYDGPTPLDTALTSGNEPLIDRLRTDGAHPRAGLPPA